MLRQKALMNSQPGFNVLGVLEEGCVLDCVRGAIEISIKNMVVANNYEGIEALKKLVEPYAGYQNKQLKILRDYVVSSHPSSYIQMMLLSTTLQEYRENTR